MLTMREIIRGCVIFQIPGLKQMNRIWLSERIRKNVLLEIRETLLRIWNSENFAPVKMLLRSYLFALRKLRR